MPLQDLNFTLFELLSLLGLVQVVYILVYMAFRAGNIKTALLPAFYFALIGAAFFFDFGRGFISEVVPYYDVWLWLFWFSGPPVSVLLILQIARIRQLPSFGNFFLLFLIPLAWGAAGVFTALDPDCAGIYTCDVYGEWLVLAGSIAGTVSLITVWAHKGLLNSLRLDPKARARYWLVMSLIILNVIFLAVMLVGLTPVLDPAAARLARTVTGLGLVYIAGTSLFRIYPQTVETQSRQARRDLTKEEKRLAQKIEDLFELDKIYQEPEYSRSDLARELETSETTVSKIINDHFNKSLPQLMNEHRVEDAKRLLAQTDAPVKVIASEVGFNSTTSFNRAFKEFTDTTPSRYRKQSRA